MCLEEGLADGDAVLAGERLHEGLEGGVTALVVGEAQSHLHRQHDGGEGGVERLEVVSELDEDGAEHSLPPIGRQGGKVIVEAPEGADGLAAIEEVALDGTDFRAGQERGESDGGLRRLDRGRGADSMRMCNLLVGGGKGNSGSLK